MTAEREEPKGGEDKNDRQSAEVAQISANQESGDADLVRGPHGWLNWYAERAGDPRREDSHPDSMVIRPLQHCSLSHPVMHEFIA